MRAPFDEPQTEEQPERQVEGHQEEAHRVEQQRVDDPGPTSTPIMGLSLKLFGIVKYLLNYLMNFDFLALIVEEYKLLEVKLLGLNFAGLIVDCL